MRGVEAEGESAIAPGTECTELGARELIACSAKDLLGESYFDHRGLTSTIAQSNKISTRWNRFTPFVPTIPIH